MLGDDILRSCSMFIFRRLITSGLIGFLVSSCADAAQSSTEYTKQIVQENNVARLMAQVQDSQKVSNLLSQGNGFLDRGRYEEALQLYNRAIEIEKDSVPSWVNRGNALLSLKQYEEALRSYNQAIALRPNKNEAWYNRGNALSALGRYEEAIRSYNESIVIEPNKFEAWINKGIALTKLRRYQEGLASYNQAISINPNFAAAYYNKACNYALQKQTDLAVKSLAKAIKMERQKYTELAKADNDFIQVKYNREFQNLLK
ncbi:tetratricopeptide repeat protein [Cylindrospermopsis raciborskii CHAB3438]|uniref:tetratricopeptide repeat protein n=1 Tax=Cylindrospermopsis raciborskii TaxID=77022 RepID=UPI001F109E66|nr:tetratricopeptide repeat protein [Cylindrospermopsis raciborskii]MCH4903838.1 tetratricopeptide repeat protein [Cylindrospermopsis raciborskii CHAB3438]MEB3146949.1 tetratricopeptide repeat protein [Cylindrospermopsis raciborskii]